MASATLTHPAGGSTKRVGLTLNASDVALLRLLRDRMTGSMGRTSYVGVIRYGLHLVAAHLGETDLPLDIPEAAPAPPDPD